MSIFNDQRHYFVQVHHVTTTKRKPFFVCLRTRFVGDFKMLVSYWFVDSPDYFKVESKKLRLF